MQNELIISLKSCTENFIASFYINRFLLYHMKLKNLLLIAGTGSKSGKTTFACRIIEQIRHQKIAAIKITPHFHETTAGLVLLSEHPGYSVYRETNKDSTKDTSRMLYAGASDVYFAKVNDTTLLTAFIHIMRLIPENSPVICESPALRHFIDPGLFIIMSSETIIKQKDISTLRKLPHVSFTLEELDNLRAIPVDFNNGNWIYEG
jgi:hypothetical protein